MSERSSPENRSAFGVANSEGARASNGAGAPGRLAGFALAAIAVLFALQTVCVCLALQTFMAMYKDFGAGLPLLSQLASECFVVWMGVAVVIAALAVVLAKRPLHSRSTFVWLGLLALLEFVLAQSLTVSVWLPMSELATATSGGS